MKDNQIDKLITQELNSSVEKLGISTELRNKIKAETMEKSSTPFDILRAFLNRQLEIPLVPLVAGAAIVIVIALTPFKGLKTVPDYGKIVTASQYTTISLGNVSIIIDKNSKGDDLNVNN